MSEICRRCGWHEATQIVDGRPVCARCAAGLPPERAVLEAYREARAKRDPAPAVELTAEDREWLKSMRVKPW
jgi:hypothetical protein